MAMTGAGLGTAIQTQIKGGMPGIVVDDAQFQAFCNSIGEAVVKYIKDNADVTVTVSTITSCGAGAGTGSGTGAASGPGAIS